MTSRSVFCESGNWKRTPRNMRPPNYFQIAWREKIPHCEETFLLNTDCLHQQNCVCTSFPSTSSKRLAKLSRVQIGLPHSLLFPYILVSIVCYWPPKPSDIEHDTFDTHTVLNSASHVVSKVFSNTLRTTLQSFWGPSITTYFSNVFYYYYISTGYFGAYKWNIYTG
jgi:hypothetical protein